MLLTPLCEHTFWNIGITSAVCSSARMSYRVRSIPSEPLDPPPPFFFLTKLGMVVYYHEAMCHAEKIGSLSSMSRSQRGLL